MIPLPHRLWSSAAAECEALLNIQRTLENQVDQNLLQQLHLRIAQTSGCVLCAAPHRRAAESQEAALQVQEQSPICSEADRAALAWAESLTRLSTRAHADDSRSVDRAREDLKKHFAEKDIVLLTFSIAMLNAVHRVQAGFGVWAAQQQGPVPSGDDR
jgi:AhpD family alkylhydroperoxidase